MAVRLHINPVHASFSRFGIVLTFTQVACDGVIFCSDPLDVKENYADEIPAAKT